MLQMIRTLAASVAILPLVAGLALAQGGATPLDQALAAQDAAAPDRRVEARRVVEEAFLGSTLHLVRLSDGAGGSRFLIGRQGDLPALSAFDTPERLIAWTHANFTADQREQMGEFSGPAADFLALLNERTGGDLVLAVNAGAEHSLSIDPVFFRFLAAQARQSADLPAVADGTPAPVTPLEWHAYIREQGDVDAEAAGLALRQAVLDAAVNRMRPILLTAVTSLAGFLPLLFAQGTGAASRISIGTVVFSGLLVASLLSLFAVPAVYLMLKRDRMPST